MWGSLRRKKAHNTRESVDLSMNPCVDDKLTNTGNELGDSTQHDEKKNDPLISSEFGFFPQNTEVLIQIDSSKSGMLLEELLAVMPKSKRTKEAIKIQKISRGHQARIPPGHKRQQAIVKRDNLLRERQVLPEIIERAQQREERYNLLRKRQIMLQPLLPEIIEGARERDGGSRYLKYKHKIKRQFQQREEIVEKLNRSILSTIRGIRNQLNQKKLLEITMKDSAMKNQRRLMSRVLTQLRKQQTQQQRTMRDRFKLILLKNEWLLRDAKTNYHQCLEEVNKLKRKFSEEGKYGPFVWVWLKEPSVDEEEINKDINAIKYNYEKLKDAYTKCTQDSEQARYIMLLKRELLNKLSQTFTAEYAAKCQRSSPNTHCYFADHFYKMTVYFWRQMPKGSSMKNINIKPAAITLFSRYQQKIKNPEYITAEIVRKLTQSQEKYKAIIEQCEKGTKGPEKRTKLLTSLSPNHFFIQHRKLFYSVLRDIEQMKRNEQSHACQENSESTAPKWEVKPHV